LVLARPFSFPGTKEAFISSQTTFKFASNYCAFVGQFCIFPLDLAGHHGHFILFFWGAGAAVYLWAKRCICAVFNEFLLFRHAARESFIVHRTTATDGRLTR